MSAHESHEDVGSVGEEAAKLFDAFTEVFAAGRAEQAAGQGESAEATDDGAQKARWSGEGLAALAAEAMSALRDTEAHVATGSEDCRICPLCRAIHAVRETTPEVRGHLVTAARSLLAAGTALVDQLDQPPTSSAAPPSSSRPGRTRRPSGSGVQRIDLDDQQDQQHDQQHDQHGAPGSQEEHR